MELAGQFRPAGRVQVTCSDDQSVLRKAFYLHCEDAFMGAILGVIFGESPRTPIREHIPLSLRGLGSPLFKDAPCGGL